MKTYKVFRSFGKLDKDIRMHELVAVETGADIYAVTNRLLKAVERDALDLEKYRHGFTAAILPPEHVSSERVKRYAYQIVAVLMPKYGDHNDLIDYGIIEEPMK